jgi:hypothetical protein
MIETAKTGDVGFKHGTVLNSLRNILNTMILSDIGRQVEHLLEFERNILRFYASNLLNFMHPFQDPCI